MAVTAATKLSDFSGFLTPEQAAPIFEDAARQSAAMRLIPQEPLSANGKAIPVWLTEPTAAWVNEGGQKPVTKGSMDLVTMAPKKIAAIAVMSKEVVRSNPGGYATAIRGKFAEAFAAAFDAAVFHGTNTPFAAHLAQTTNAVTLGTAANEYLDIVSGLNLVLADGGRITAFAWDETAEPVLLNAVDGNKRPLLAPSTAEGAYGSIIGRPSYLAAGVGDATIAGFGGNWNKARWGVVGGIQYEVSTEASVTINGEYVSLFENNLVAVLAEAEYGFVVSGLDNFVAYNYEAVVS